MFFKLFQLCILVLAPVVSLTCSHQCGFLKITSLLSDTTSCSLFILYISYPNCRVRYFCRKPCFLLLEDGSRDQDLGTRCAHFYWGVISFRPSQSTEQGNICMCTSPCIYISIIYVIIYSYIKLNVSSY